MLNKEEIKRYHEDGYIIPDFQMPEDDLLEIWEKEKLTVLFVTHSVSEAIYLSQRIIVLSSGPGRIIYEKNIDYNFSKKDFLASNEYQIINNEIFEKLRTGVNNE